MAIDRRLNCAAAICCPPPMAMKALTGILTDLGCPAEKVDTMAQAMTDAGLVFMPRELAEVIAAVVDHPGRNEVGGQV